MLEVLKNKAWQKVRKTLGHKAKALVIILKLQVRYFIYELILSEGSFNALFFAVVRASS